MVSTVAEEAVLDWSCATERYLPTPQAARLSVQTATPASKAPPPLEALLERVHW
ncbi:hypothetical protein D3C86_2239380 [compost metagenome]